MLGLSFDGKAMGEKENDSIGKSDKNSPNSGQQMNATTAANILLELNLNGAGTDASNLENDSEISESDSENECDLSTDRSDSSESNSITNALLKIISKTGKVPANVTMSIFNTLQQIISTNCDYQPVVLTENTKKEVDKKTNKACFLVCELSEKNGKNGSVEPSILNGSPNSKTVNSADGEDFDASNMRFCVTKDVLKKVCNIYNNIENYIPLDGINPKAIQGSLLQMTKRLNFYVTFASKTKYDNTTNSCTCIISSERSSSDSIMCTYKCNRPFKKRANSVTPKKAFIKRQDSQISKKPNIDMSTNKYNLRHRKINFRDLMGLTGKDESAGDSSTEEDTKLNRKRKISLEDMRSVKNCKLDCDPEENRVYIETDYCDDEYEILKYHKLVNKNFLNNKVPEKCESPVISKEIKIILEKCDSVKRSTRLKRSKQRLDIFDEKNDSDYSMPRRSENCVEETMENIQLFINESLMDQTSNQNLESGKEKGTTNESGDDSFESTKENSADESVNIENTKIETEEIRTNEEIDTSMPLCIKIEHTETLVDSDIELLHANVDECEEISDDEETSQRTDENNYTLQMEMDEDVSNENTSDKVSNNNVLTDNSVSDVSKSDTCNEDNDVNKTTVDQSNELLNNEMQTDDLNETCEEVLNKTNNDNVSSAINIIEVSNNTIQMDAIMNKSETYNEVSKETNDEFNVSENQSSKVSIDKDANINISDENNDTSKEGNINYENECNEDIIEVSSTIMEVDNEENQIDKSDECNDVSNDESEVNASDNYSCESSNNTVLIDTVPVENEDKESDEQNDVNGTNEVEDDLVVSNNDIQTDDLICKSNELDETINKSDLCNEVLDETKDIESNTSDHKEEYDTLSGSSISNSLLERCDEVEKIDKDVIDKFETNATPEDGGESIEVLCTVQDKVITNNEVSEVSNVLENSDQYKIICSNNGDLNEGYVNEIVLTTPSLNGLNTDENISEIVLSRLGEQNENDMFLQVGSSVTIASDLEGQVFHEVTIGADGVAEENVQYDTQVLGDLSEFITINKGKKIELDVVEELGVVDNNVEIIQKEIEGLVDDSEDESLVEENTYVNDDDVVVVKRALSDINEEEVEDMGTFDSDNIIYCTYNETENTFEEVPKGIDGSEYVLNANGTISSIQEAVVKQEGIEYKSGDISKLPSYIKCKICRKEINRDSLLRHLKRHVGIKFCPYCSKSFNDIATYNEHVSTHKNNEGNEKYMCFICRKKFCFLKNIFKHVKRAHPNDTEYNDMVIMLPDNGKNNKNNLFVKDNKVKKRMKLCTVCNQPVSNFYYKRHLLSHSGERPFACSHCDKRFTEKSTLKNHIRTHTGERPYTCEKCGKSFGHISTLAKHSNIHTSARRYQCSVCGKLVSSAYNLKMHYRIHTGERPFGCSDCEKNFMSKVALDKHLVVYHS